MLTLLLAGSAAAEVTIKGGMNESNPYDYEWTVTNHGEPPITLFEIPHYRGLVPRVPSGWTFEITEKAEYEEKVGMGRLTATAPPDRAIRDGQSATFGLQLHIKGATVRIGSATIGFADGRKVQIPGVEHPGTPSWISVYAGPLGLTVLVGGLLIVRLLRRRRQSSGAG